MQRLTRWGNSCGIRLEMGVLEAAGLKVGDYVSVRCMNSGDVRIRPQRRQPVDAEAAEEIAQPDPPPQQW